MWNGSASFFLFYILCKCTTRNIMIKIMGIYFCSPYSCNTLHKQYRKMLFFHLSIAFPNKRTVHSNYNIIISKQKFFIAFYSIPISVIAIGII